MVAAFVKKVQDLATRRAGNGKASKVQASIGRYVVREHVGTLGGISTSENVKESSEYAPHSSTTNPMRSAPTRTANMKGNTGSDDGWCNQAHGRDNKASKTTSRTTLQRAPNTQHAARSTACCLDSLEPRSLAAPFY